MPNNPLTEVGTLVIAGLLIIGGVLLLYVSKIDTAFATSMFILAAGLLGITGALKAPSPQQQAQIGQLAQASQTLTSQVVAALPTTAQPQVTPAPVQPPPPSPFASTPQGPQVPFPQDTGRFPVPPQQQ